MSWEFERGGKSEDGLLEALSNIPLPKSFPCALELSRHIPAGLFVDGIGDIAMPLNDTQARQMIEKAHPLPPGGRLYENTDITIRGEWALDANQFSFRDPAWPNFVQSLCSQFSQQLGINRRVTAKVAQMHIYESGASPTITEHSRLEDVRPGTFGLLFLCLPSRYQGGYIQLQYREREECFETSGPRSYAFFFPQSPYNVFEVESGFLWLLVFDLGLDPSVPRPLRTIQLLTVEKLRGALGRWLSEMKKRPKSICAYHVLGHKYTKANFSLQDLKMQDLDQVQVLKALSREFPIEIFLAKLEQESRGFYYKEERSESDDDDDDSDDSDCLFVEFEDDGTEQRVKAMVDLDGNTVLKGLLPNGALLQDKRVFLDVEEKEKQTERDKYGVYRQISYRQKAVAIVPHDSLPGFFTADYWFDELGCSKSQQARENLDSMIRYLGRAYLHLQGPESLGKGIVKLCRYAWNTRDVFHHCRNRNPIITGDGMCLVLQIAVLLGDFEFFEEASPRHGGFLPPDFFVWLRHWLKIGENGAEARFKAIRNGATTTLLAYNFFVDRFKAIENLAPILRDSSTHEMAPTPSYMMDWARRALHLSIKNRHFLEYLGNEDGPAMVDCALYFDDPLEFISKTVAPAIEPRHDATAFLLTFRDRMLQQSAKGVFPMEVAMNFPQTQSLVHSMDFKYARSDGDDECPDWLANRQVPRVAISHELLASFFSDVVKIKTGTDDLVAVLVSKITTDAHNIPITVFYTLWLPFLHSLIPIFISNGIPLDSMNCQQIFSVMLSAYVKIYVGQRPEKDEGLAREEVPCYCPNCESLNTFLRSSWQRDESFYLDIGDSPHFESCLEDSKDLGDYTFKMRQFCSGPSIFRVTKTGYKKKKFREWDSRLEQAREKLSEFDQHHLQLILGSYYSVLFNILHQQSGSNNPELWIPLERKLGLN